MLKKNIIVIGGTGFIGSTICSMLKKDKKKFLSLNSKNCNLLKKSAINILKRNIKNGDVIIFVSAIAPCKNQELFQKNLDMLRPLMHALKDKKISHLIYISSDAVYKDSKNKLNENSLVEPNSIHGLMHQTRENLLKLSFYKKLSIIRPTLVYGPLDTHNGYGPNYFARKAMKNEEIKIFGNGEEIRDHVYVEDIANLAKIIIQKKLLGIFNAVSGDPVTFFKLAQLIKKKLNSKSKIKKIKRKGPMPHNGYRCFDINILKKKIKKFTPTKYKDGICNLKKILKL
jgi:UDP-glucose 4-epimerase